MNSPSTSPFTPSSKRILSHVSSPSPTKRPKTSSTVVLQDSSRRNRTITVDVDASSLTPHQVYLAAADTSLGEGNSFDLSMVKQCEGSDDWTASIADTSREDRSTLRKVLFSQTLKRLDHVEKTLYQRDLVSKAKTLKEIKKQKKELAKANPTYRYEVFSNLLQSLNDIIFNPNPSPEERRHRGTTVLTEEQITDVKQCKPYISGIIKWEPTNKRTNDLKTLALSCLTSKQLKLAEVLLNSGLTTIYRETRNELHHPRPSKQFAKFVVDEEIQRTKPGNVPIKDFHDAIDNAPSPIQRADSRTVEPFFQEEDDENSPAQIELEIKELETELAALEASIAHYENNV